mmetsp:Transcript_32464/g.85467  ORF Transcript_32464/g.85467 Transcript_32464/m.85467 type:complete len:238 (-) Transcript_32464:220-933(-)
MRAHVMSSRGAVKSLSSKLDARGLYSGKICFSLLRRITARSKMTSASSRSLSASSTLCSHLSTSDSTWISFDRALGSFPPFNLMSSFITSSSACASSNSLQYASKRLIQSPSAALASRSNLSPLGRSIFSAASAALACDSKCSTFMSSFIVILVLWSTSSASSASLDFSVAALSVFHLAVKSRNSFAFIIFSAIFFSLSASFMAFSCAMVSARTFLSRASRLAVFSSLSCSIASRFF